MSYNYTTFQTALAQMMAIPNANIASPNFVLILPTIIDYAEQRCYRDLDLLNATLTITSVLTALQRRQSITPPSGVPPILILENFNVVLASGERVPLCPTSREWIDAIYGGPSTAAMPKFYGMVDDQTIVLGPWPDQPYYVEFVGKFRPLPLYQGAQPILITATAAFAAGYYGVFMPPNPGTIIAGALVFDVTLGGAALGTVSTYAPVNMSVTAASQWKAGDSSFTLNNALNVGVIPGLTCTDSNITPTSLLVNAAASFAAGYYGVFMPPNPGTIIAGALVFDVTLGISLGAVNTPFFQSAPCTPVHYLDQASGHWTAGATSFPYNNAQLEGVIPGLTVFDDDLNQSMGTVASVSGNIVTMTAPISFSAYGTEDHITFDSGGKPILYVSKPFPANSSGNNDQLQISVTNNMGTVASVSGNTVTMTAPMPFGAVSASDKIKFSSGGQHVLYVSQPLTVSSSGPNDQLRFTLNAPPDQTTYLTTTYPDLFLAAAMVSAAAYQKNFGAQADDPKMAQSWETQYQSLLMSAKIEEMRKKQHGWQALTSESSPPPTQPPPPPGG